MIIKPIDRSYIIRDVENNSISIDAIWQFDILPAPGNGTCFYYSYLRLAGYENPTKEEIARVKLNILDLMEQDWDEVQFYAEWSINDNTPVKAGGFEEYKQLNLMPETYTSELMIRYFCKFYEIPLIILNNDLMTDSYSLVFPGDIFQFPENREPCILFRFGQHYEALEQWTSNPKNWKSLVNKDYVNSSSITDQKKTQPVTKIGDESPPTSPETSSLDAEVRKMEMLKKILENKKMEKRPESLESSSDAVDAKRINILERKKRRLQKKRNKATDNKGIDKQIEEIEKQLSILLRDGKHRQKPEPTRVRLDTIPMSTEGDADESISKLKSYNESLDKLLPHWAKESKEIKKPFFSESLSMMESEASSWYDDLIEVEQTMKFKRPFSGDQINLGSRIDESRLVISDDSDFEIEDLTLASSEKPSIAKQAFKTVEFAETATDHTKRISSFGGTYKQRKQRLETGTQKTQELRLGSVLGNICSSTVVYYLDENNNLIFDSKVHATRMNEDFNHLADLKSLRCGGRDNNKKLVDAIMKASVIISKDLLRSCNHFYLYTTILPQNWTPYFGSLPETQLDQMNRLILSYIFSVYLYEQKDNELRHRLIFSGCPDAEDLSTGISQRSENSLTKIALTCKKKFKYYQQPVLISRTLVMLYFKELILTSYKILSQLMPKYINLIVSTDKSKTSVGVYLGFLDNLLSQQSKELDNNEPINSVISKLSKCVEKLCEVAEIVTKLKEKKYNTKRTIKVINEYYELVNAKGGNLSILEPQEQSIVERYNSNLEIITTSTETLEETLEESSKLLREKKQEISVIIQDFFLSLNITKVMTSSGAARSASTLESLINFSHIYPKGENLESEDVLTLDDVRIKLYSLVKTIEMNKPLPMIFEFVKDDFENLFGYINEEYRTECMLKFEYAKTCTSHDLSWNTLLILKGMLHEIFFAQTHSFKYIPEVQKSNLKQVIQTYFPLKFTDFLDRTCGHTEYRLITADFIFAFNEPGSTLKLLDKLRELQNANICGMLIDSESVESKVNIQQKEGPQNETESFYSESTYNQPVDPLPESTNSDIQRNRTEALMKISELISQAEQSNKLIRHNDPDIIGDTLLIIETGFVTDYDNKSQQDWMKWQGPIRVLKKIGINAKVIVAIDSTKGPDNWFIKDVYRDALRSSISKLFGLLAANSPPDVTAFHVSNISTTGMRKAMKSHLGMLPPISQADINAYWNMCKEDIKVRPTGFQLPETFVNRVEKLMTQGAIFDPEYAEEWFNDFFSPQRLESILSFYYKVGKNISVESQPKESAKQLLNGWLDGDSKLLLKSCIKKDDLIVEKCKKLTTFHKCLSCSKSIKQVRPTPRILNLLPENFDLKHKPSTPGPATELDEVVRLILPSFTQNEKSVKRAIQNIIKHSMLLSGLKAVKDGKGIIYLCPGLRDTIKQMLMNPSKKDQKLSKLEDKLKEYREITKKDFKYLQENMKGSYSERHFQLVSNLYEKMDKQAESGCALKESWLSAIYNDFSLDDSKTDKLHQLAETIENRSVFTEQDRFWKLDETIICRYFEIVYNEYNCLSINRDSGLKPDCIIFEEQFLILETSLKDTVYRDLPSIIKNIVTVLSCFTCFQYYFFFSLLANEFLTCTTEFNGAAVKVKKIKHSPYNLVMKIPNNKTTNVKCCLYNSDFKAVGSPFFLNRTTATLWKSYPYIVISIVTQLLQTHSCIECLQDSINIESILSTCESMCESVCTKSKSIVLSAYNGSYEYNELRWSNEVFHRTAQVFVSTLNSLMITLGMQLHRNSKIFNKQIQMMRFSYMASLSSSCQFYELGKKFSASCRYIETHVARLVLQSISFTSLSNVKLNVKALIEDSIRPNWKMMSTLNFCYISISDRTLISDCYPVHIFNKEMEDYDKGCEAIFEEVAEKYFDYEQDLETATEEYKNLFMKFHKLTSSKKPESFTERRLVEERIKNLKKDYNELTSKINCILGVPRIKVSSKSRRDESEEIYKESTGFVLNKPINITSSGSSGGEDSSSSMGGSSVKSLGSRMLRESEAVTNPTESLRSSNRFVFRSYSGSLHSLNSDTALVVDKADDYNLKAVGTQQITKYRPKSDQIWQSMKICIENSRDHSTGVCELVQGFTQLFRNNLTERRVQQAYRDPDNWCPISRVVETTSIVSKPLLEFSPKEALKRTKGSLIQKTVKMIKNVTKEIADTDDKQKQRKERIESVITELMDIDIPINRISIDDIKKQVIGTGKIFNSNDWKHLINSPVEDTVIHPDSNRVYSIIKGVFKHCRSCIKFKKLEKKLLKQTKDKDKVSYEVVDEHIKNYINLPRILGERIFSDSSKVSHISKDMMDDFKSSWARVALDDDLFTVDNFKFRPEQIKEYEEALTDLLQEFCDVNELLKDEAISFEKEKIALCTHERKFCAKFGKIITRYFIWALQLSSTAHWLEQMKAVSPAVLSRMLEEMEEDVGFVVKEGEITDEEELKRRLKESENSKPSLLKNFIDPTHALDKFISKTEIISIRYACAMFEANDLPIASIIGGQGKTINTNQFNLLHMLKGCISKGVLLGHVIDFPVVVNFIYNSNHNMMKTLTNRKGNLKLPRSTRSKVMFEIISLVSSCNSAVVQQIAYKILQDYNHNLYTVLAPKAQHGGTRDLFVQETGMKMINASSELLAGSFLKLTTFDGLTNPSMTKMMLSDFSNEFKKSKELHGNLRRLADNTVDPSRRTIYKISSILGDKSKWGPKHIVTLFSALHQQLHHKNPEHDKCQKLVMLKNLVKKIEVPIAIVGKVVRSALYNKNLDSTTVSRLDKEEEAILEAIQKASENWSWKPLIKNTIDHHLLKRQQYIRPANHMGQGIHHRTSSLTTAIWREIFNKLILTFCEARLDKRLTVETYAVGSSDDYARRITIRGDVPIENFDNDCKMIDKLFVDIKNLESAICLCINMKDSPKSICMEAGCEVYSQFIIGDRETPAVIKFITANMITSNITSPLSLTQMEHVSNQQSNYNSCSILTVMTTDLCRRQIHLNFVERFVREYLLLLYRSPTSLSHSTCPKLSMLMCNGLAATDLDVIESVLKDIKYYSPKIRLSPIGERPVEKHLFLSDAIYTSDAETSSSSSPWDNEVDKDYLKDQHLKEPSILEGYSLSSKLIILTDSNKNTCSHYTKSIIKKDDDSLSRITKILSELPDSMLFELQRKTNTKEFTIKYTNSLGREFQICLSSLLHLLNTLINIVYISYYRNEIADSIDKQFKANYNLNFGAILKSPFVQLTPSSVLTMVEKLKETQEDLKNYIKIDDDVSASSMVAERIIALNCLTEDTLVETSRLLQACRNPRVAWGLTQSNKEYSNAMLALAYNSFHMIDYTNITHKFRWVKTDNVYIKDSSGMSVGKSIKTKFTYWIDCVISCGLCISERGSDVAQHEDPDPSKISLFDGLYKPCKVEPTTTTVEKTVYIKHLFPSHKTEFVSDETIEFFRKEFVEKFLPADLEKLESCTVERHYQQQSGYSTRGLMVVFKIKGTFFSLDKFSIVINPEYLGFLIEKCVAMRDTILDDNTKKMRRLEYQTVRSKFTIDDFFVQKSTVYGKRGSLQVVNNLAVIIAYWLQPVLLERLRVLGVKYDHLQSDQANLSISCPEIKTIINEIQKLDSNELELASTDRAKIEKYSNHLTSLCRLLGGATNTTMEFFMFSRTSSRITEDLEPLLSLSIVEGMAFEIDSLTIDTTVFSNHYYLILEVIGIINNLPLSNQSKEKLLQMFLRSNPHDFSMDLGTENCQDSEAEIEILESFRNQQFCAILLSDVSSMTDKSKKMALSALANYVVNNPQNDLSYSSISDKTFKTFGSEQENSERFIYKYGRTSASGYKFNNKLHVSINKPLSPTSLEDLLNEIMIWQKIKDKSTYKRVDECVALLNLFPCQSDAIKDYNPTEKFYFGYVKNSFQQVPPSNRAHYMFISKNHFVLHSDPELVHNTKPKLAFKRDLIEIRAPRTYRQVESPASITRALEIISTLTNSKQLPVSHHTAAEQDEIIFNIELPSEFTKKAMRLAHIFLNHCTKSSEKSVFSALPYSRNLGFSTIRKAQQSYQTQYLEYFNTISDRLKSGKSVGHMSSFKLYKKDEITLLINNPIEVEELLNKLINEKFDRLEQWPLIQFILDYLDIKTQKWEFNESSSLKWKVSIDHSKYTTIEKKEDIIDSFKRGVSGKYTRLLSKLIFIYDGLIQIEDLCKLLTNCISYYHLTNTNLIKTITMVIVTMSQKMVEMSITKGMTMRKLGNNFLSCISHLELLSMILPVEVESLNKKSRLVVELDNDWPVVEESIILTLQDVQKVITSLLQSWHKDQKAGKNNYYETLVNKGLLGKINTWKLKNSGSLKEYLEITIGTNKHLKKTFIYEVITEESQLFSQYDPVNNIDLKSAVEKYTIQADNDKLVLTILHRITSVDPSKKTIQDTMDLYGIFENCTGYKENEMLGASVWVAINILDAISPFKREFFIYAEEVDLLFQNSSYYKNYMVKGSPKSESSRFGLDNTVDAKSEIIEFDLEDSDSESDNQQKKIEMKDPTLEVIPKPEPPKPLTRAQKRLLEKERLKRERDLLE